MKSDLYGAQWYVGHYDRSRVLISFEVWAKLAQKCLVYAPLRLYLEPIN